MAIGAGAVWDVRPTTGDNQNGAGFDSALAGAGTNYSTQGAAQLSITDIAHTGGSTTITSATGGFTSAMIGNAIRIYAGTNFIVGYYFITGFTSTNQITIDRSCGATTASGGSGKVGGATKGITTQAAPTLANSIVVPNKIFIKNESWNEAVALTLAGNNTNQVIWEGYNVTQGDNPSLADCPHNNRGGAAGVGWDCAAATDNIIKNIWVSNAGGNGFESANKTIFVNCRASNNGSSGFSLDGSTRKSVIGCESYSNTLYGFYTIAGTNNFATYWGCYSHDNTSEGFHFAPQDGHSLLFCISEANSSHGVGIQSTNSSLFLYNCTIDGNTGATTDGFNIPGSMLTGGSFLNNSFTNNGRYGVNATTTSGGTGTWCDYNNFFGNGSGSRNNFNTGSHDISVNPSYVDRTNGNFAVGSSMSAVAFPGTFPGSLSVGYLDIGAVQRVEPTVPTNANGIFSSYRVLR